MADFGRGIGWLSADKLRYHGLSYLAQLLADRDKWVDESGLVGWQAEMDRRRAERIRLARNRKHENGDA